jgi:UDP-N-acetyl-D-galactosamine dehydrogenase
VAVIGLGYVGLPLAVGLARHFPTIGFDIDSGRVQQLQAGVDRTGEVSAAELRQATQLTLSDNCRDLAESTVYIITVPTPVDANNLPDLQPLEAASVTIGRLLKPGDVVVYESTVYPGATEEFCAGILERESGLQFNRDFTVGYSPERINPGDKVHRLQTITKVVAASTPETAERLKALYETVVTAGVYVAPDIKTAEAAKAIENTQRDVNIAFMNELAQMFHHLGLDTHAVIETAATKWNFLPFTPGLVGGHCIGVDPYYLIHKAQESGYFPQLITTARRLNQEMPAYVAERLLKRLALQKIHVVGARILILGVTFKENCPDLRNTRVVDVVRELQQYHACVDVHDPWADAGQAQAELGFGLTEKPLEGAYDAIVLAVPHEQFIANAVKNIGRWRKPHSVVFDLKNALPGEIVDERL